MKKVILFTAVILVLFLAGCGTQTLYMCKDGTPGGNQIPGKGKIIFFCPDGSETENINTCHFIKETTVSLKDARTKSIDFVTGYVRASGWTATLINVYPQEGDFYGQVVISKRNEQSYETLVKIDGRKGITNCEENCFYTTQIE